MDRLVDAAFHQTNAYSQAFLALLLTKARATPGTKVGKRDAGAGCRQDVLEGYADDVAYQSMNRDRVRNACFARWIQQGSAHGPQRWLEIGPGAEGTLTRMALDAHPGNTVTAIEAVPQSVRKLGRLAVRERRRLRVVEGFAGEADVGAGAYDALLAEVLGHLASSEGYVAVLRLCGERYPRLRAVRQAIPRRFGTMVVPVDLTPARRLSVSVIHENLVLFDDFPLAATQLSASHGVFEMYDALEELNQRNPSRRVFRSSWTVTGTRPFHGLLCYLVFGSETETVSSLACRSWSQVFIPVHNGDFVCRDGDHIELTTTCRVHKPEPEYRLDLRVRRNQRAVYSTTINIDYFDLMGTATPLRDFHKSSPHDASSASTTVAEARPVST